MIYRHIKQNKTKLVQGEKGIVWSLEGPLLSTLLENRDNPPLHKRQSLFHCRGGPSPVQVKPGPVRSRVRSKGFPGGDGFESQKRIQSHTAHNRRSGLQAVKHKLRRWIRGVKRKRKRKRPLHSATRMGSHSHSLRACVCAMPLRRKLQQATDTNTTTIT